MPDPSKKQGMANSANAKKAGRPPKSLTKVDGQGTEGDKWTSDSPAAGVSTLRSGAERDAAQANIEGPQGGAYLRARRRRWLQVAMTRLIPPGRSGKRHGVARTYARQRRKPRKSLRERAGSKGC
mmetsp:Transcript_11438/g.28425  ORF Transcript_11438/g.28425 Transcript_11438/m.28425 type:complete len:125 (-) Transcript_11438:369-743(-)